MGSCTAGNEPCEGDNFAPGPMAVLVDQIAEYTIQYSPMTAQAMGFVSEGTLSHKAKRAKQERRGSVGLPGKKKDKETNYFFTNARMLAQEAKEKESHLEMKVVAVLFRDSDGTVSSGRGLWETKVKSIQDGFTQEDFARGVPMVPKPKSEAWLLCALRENYTHCVRLEKSSGNDVSSKSLKRQLKEHLGFEPGPEELVELVTTHRIDFQQIKMPSFDFFRGRLESAIREA